MDACSQGSDSQGDKRRHLVQFVTISKKIDKQFRPLCEPALVNAVDARERVITKGKKGKGRVKNVEMAGCGMS
jgi:hypothetical protein